MRHPSRYALLAIATVVAGCATAPVPVATAPHAAPITVSCTEASLSDTPCVAMAKEKCATPRVDTIRLVLATPDEVEDAKATKKASN